MNLKVEVEKKCGIKHLPSKYIRIYVYMYFVYSFIYFIGIIGMFNNISCLFILHTKSARMY